MKRAACPKCGIETPHTFCPPRPSHPEAHWTREDETNAKLIAILLFVSKILEGVRRDMKLPVEETLKIAARKAKAFEDLVKLTHASFPNDGEMELQVIAFAKRIGFEIEQTLITEGSKRTQ